MISVGIDVSKGKSTVCILKPYGEIVCSPFEIQHVEKDLEDFHNLLQKLDGEIRMVMEATGVYHLPVLTFLHNKEYFVSVINPFAMKKYAKDNSLRGAKTDKLDSRMIANYGIEKWFKLQRYEGDEETYAELKLLGRRYRYYMELHVKALQELTHILDYTMPGIKDMFSSWNEANGKDKLSDFVERFWHFDLITSMSIKTERRTEHADVPVAKSKEEYTRAQWQIDAHGYWRSSGDRLIAKEELENISVDNLQAVYREYSRQQVYSYKEHVELAKKLDENGKLPATFMVVAPGSWNQLEVWDDINRMRTLNANQSRRRQQMHVCPLQLDIVERIINRYSNEGDVVYDPFGGLMTVPMSAVKMGRYGKGCELNPDYFRDGVGYLQAAEEELEMPTLFDVFPEVLP